MRSLNFCDSYRPPTTNICAESQQERNVNERENKRNRGVFRNGHTFTSCPTVLHKHCNIATYVSSKAWEFIYREDVLTQLVKLINKHKKNETFSNFFTYKVYTILELNLHLTKLTIQNLLRKESSIILNFQELFSIGHNST